MLVCASATGTWVRELACLGPGGCRSEGGAIECDDSLSKDGELCAHDGQRACSIDGGALLRCAEGRFREERRCACTVRDAGLQCE